MEKQGWVSIWFGNVNNRDSLGQYVDLLYDENGESIPSKFFIDFNIDMDETDEDTIEKVVYKNSSNDISNLLKGCSYDKIIIQKVKEKVKLKKTYNAVILIYNFKYNKKISSTGNFDFITSTSYDE